MTKLIIVESPGKIDKISLILGDGYKVVASFGHIRDLDPKTLSIDIANNFTPNYMITQDKLKVVQNLRYNAAQCDEVIIASDMDREGEMIAHSIKEVLKLDNPKRIVFNEITKKAILDAVANPTIISDDMMYAQQTRRLLDRLVGYKISPLLWKEIQGKLSAGRVQSVVARIIIDLENEIKEYSSNMFFKTNAIFTKDDMSIPCTLILNKENFKIMSKDIALELLSFINKQTTYVVKNITDKKTKRSPPPPHITSSLMQEASTKCGMNSKRTMDTAQKLYEMGHITYMRTDSTILSNDAILDCKKFIEATYGSIYFKGTVHKNKGKDAQEAHEAIRPTKAEITPMSDEISKLGNDAIRLYTIIWNRTLASLMADASINVKTIEIDCINPMDPMNPKDSNLSIFNFLIASPTDKDMITSIPLFINKSETIIFDGYLVLYNDMKDENDDSANSPTNDTIDLSKITVNTLLDIKKIECSEEYTKPPLRYNEAGLIKYLKTNGIGRPSTYASIISKIVERNYVEIKNISGEQKETIILFTTNKTIGKPPSEKTKTISFGKEKNKIVPTEMGYKVNDFMMKNFEPIMDIKFTADMEKMLDRIASGKAKWYNILDTYYKLFSPMVEILEKQTSNIKNLKSDDKVIGIDPTTNNTIFLTKAKFGWCIKILDSTSNTMSQNSTNDSKWKYASIEDMDPQLITLDKAIELLSFPKLLGKIGSSNVTLNKGKYGMYFKIGTKMIGIKDNIEPTLEYAKQLADVSHDSNVFKIKSKTVHLKNGQYGYYLMIPHGTKKPTNIPVPASIDINTITAKIIDSIIEKYESKSKSTTKSSYKPKK